MKSTSFSLTSHPEQKEVVKAILTENIFKMSANQQVDPKEVRMPHKHWKGVIKQVRDLTAPNVTFDQINAMYRKLKNQMTHSNSAVLPQITQTIVKNVVPQQHVEVVNVNPAYVGRGTYSRTIKQYNDLCKMHSAGISVFIDRRCGNDMLPRIRFNPNGNGIFEIKQHTDARSGMKYVYYVMN